MATEILPSSGARELFPSKAACEFVAIRNQRLHVPACRSVVPGGAPRWSFHSVVIWRRVHWHALHLCKLKKCSPVQICIPEQSHSRWRLGIRQAPRQIHSTQVRKALTPVLHPSKTQNRRSKIQAACCGITDSVPKARSANQERHAEMTTVQKRSLLPKAVVSSHFPMVAAKNHNSVLPRGRTVDSVQDTTDVTVHVAQTIEVVVQIHSKLFCAHFTEPAVDETTRIDNNGWHLGTVQFLRHTGFNIPLLVVDGVIRSLTVGMRHPSFGGPGRCLSFTGVEKHDVVRINEIHGKEPRPALCSQFWRTSSQPIYSLLGEDTVLLEALLCIPPHVSELVPLRETKRLQSVPSAWGLTSTFLHNFRCSFRTNGTQEVHLRQCVSTEMPLSLVHCVITRFPKHGPDCVRPLWQVTEILVHTVVLKRGTCV
mmetsp:Transcript_85824/g.229626  ORF Transcript_85824/g.229626 Transcript_85824/m.229626 type:complete len:426 (-) Transcript_85824:253-1530(-)